MLDAVLFCSGLAVLCLFTAGLGWYGYTHDLIRRSIFGINAFSLFKWLLDGVLIVLGISILRSGKNADGWGGWRRFGSE